MSGNNREVIRGLGQRILIVCVGGISCESLRWANRDFRPKAENDSVGVGAFLDVNAERRMGQVFVSRLRVPVTKTEFENHPERCADALREAYENG